jgi:hypothetical protein
MIRLAARPTLTAKIRRALGMPEIDQDAVKALQRMWRDHDGKLAMGAFTGVRTTDITGWLRSGFLRLVTDDEGPVAACVVRRANKLQLVHDFRDRPIAVMVPDDVLIIRMAARKGCDDALFDLVNRARGAKSLYAYAWQEHAVEREMVERLGLTLHGVKIKSTSELIGLYGWPESQEQYSALDMTGIGQLDFTYSAELLRHDLERVNLAWSNHYSYYNDHDSWQALALRGYGGDPCFIIKPLEMTKEWKRTNEDKLDWRLEDTALYNDFPAARALVERIPARTQRVRLMRLMPHGGELQRHTDLSDPECGTDDDQIMRLHFPIVTNDQVRFESWSLNGDRQRVHMDCGQGYYLDVRKPHTARNDGERPRVHLVVDVYANQAVREMVDV